MKRFYYNTSNHWIKQVLSVGIFLLFFLLFLSGISKVSSETNEKQTENLRLAITRGIAHYYSIEGHYPESLEYLQKHYGISYNPDEYFIDYQVLGKNIYPELTIIKRKKEKTP